MNTAMTDFTYTSPVADLGRGKRDEMVNRDQVEYPDPTRYSTIKNPKVVEPHVRQRTKIPVRQAKEREVMPRRKKDRPEEDPNVRSRPPPTITGEIGSPDQSAIDPLNVQNIYTLGMDERDKRKMSTGPGPGSHEIKSKIGAGPAFKMGGPEKDTKADRDQTGPSSYNIVIKSRAPKYSFGGSAGATLGFRNNGSMKSMKPGPGAYDSRDVQFKKPTTKFSKAAKNSLTKLQGPPPSKEFNPEPVKPESDKYSFPLANRFDDNEAFKNSRQPGPGEYEVLNTLPKGQAKSMLGGSVNPTQGKTDNEPGPGYYFNEATGDYLNHIPGVKITKKPDRFREKKDDDEEERLRNYKPKEPAIKPRQHPKGWSIGRGVRDPIKSKFDTPAPNAYNVVDMPPSDDKKDDKDREKKYKFHMGMRTNYKANRGQDLPGPSSYYPDLWQPNTLAHVVGTGARSDLGVGKAYLAPGPGAYEIRGKIEGPQVKFGNEQKNTKIKKTYEPGPANYDLPGTVGNIPRYLRLKQEREEAERYEDKSENIELL